MRAALIAFILTFGTEAGAGDFSAANLIEAYQSSDESKRQLTWAFLNGALFGLSMANIHAKKVKNIALYCPPENQELDSDLAIAILKNYIGESQKRKDARAVMVLLFAFTSVFPCEE